jgi:hypothetical protein
MTLASQFIIPSSEISLYFFVYKILESFARFGDAKEHVSVDFVAALSGPRQMIPVDFLEVVLTSEEKIRGMHAQGTYVTLVWNQLGLTFHPRLGAVEFLVSNSVSGQALLLVEVKRSSKLKSEGSMPQLMAETVTVALNAAKTLGKSVIVWGALTDVFEWCDSAATTRHGSNTASNAGAGYSSRLRQCPKKTSQADVQFLWSASSPTHSFTLAAAFPSVARPRCPSSSTSSFLVRRIFPARAFDCD